jgi:hypothetical protein
MDLNAHKVGRGSRTTRSRVTNGNTILDNVDGRSAMARRYRDLMSELTSDLGDSPSGAQTAIIRRACTLIITCEQAESELLAGVKLDVAEFVTATNSLRRLLSDLGLERRAKDITPSLEKYLASGLAKPVASHSTPPTHTADVTP